MEKILNQILSEITGLKEGQSRLENRLDSLEAKLDNLEQGQHKIQKELRSIWYDILRLDKQLSAHDEELVFLRRPK